MERKLLMTMVVDLIFVVALILFNLFYLSKVVDFSTTIYFIAFLLLAAPIFFVKYQENRKIKALEETFPVFLRDFVEAIRGGMTVPQAFKSISNNDYHALTPYVKKISSQLDWGIPVEKVLLKFSRETKSKLIGRVISTVMEGHKFGGNLADTFESLSNSVFEIEKLRGERKLFVHSQMITGYIVFFVFLGVIIALGKFLVPSLSEASTLSEAVAPAATEKGVASQYQEIFRNLILIQGLFAGLSIGKMAEGAMIAGIKHSLIMMSIGFLIFTIFT